MRRKKTIIGRKDILDFPDFKIKNVPVKIDTGAFTSCIHCSNVKEEEYEGVKKLHFKILDLPYLKGKKLKCSTEDYSMKSVKNSFGNAELRYVIRSRVKIFGKVIITEFSLADRTSMRFPILLGRKLLKKRFVVDVAKANLSYNRKIQQYEDRHPIEEF